MATQYVWPPITTANPSVSGTGATAPASATEVGGIGLDGNLHGLSTTNTGVLNVNVSSTTTSPLPVTDAAAEVSVASIDTKTPALGQAAMAASSPVVIASNQTSIPVAATLQAGTALAGKFGIDQTTPGTTNAVVVTGTVPLPTGAALDSTVSTMSAKLPATLGQKAMSASMAVAIASDQSAVNTSMVDLVTTGIAAATSGNNLLAADGATATDATNYRSISIQVNSTATAGTLIFEQSNDGSTWVNVPMADATTAGSTAVVASYTPAAVTRVWQGPVNCKFVRLRVSVGLTGGSVQAISKLSNANYAPLANLVQQNTTASLQTSSTQVGTWTVQPGNTANTTAWLVTSKGLASSNAPVYNDYTSVGVTTAAYTQLIASTTAAATYIDIFDSSGQAMILATGGAGSEVILAYIPPGGDSFAISIAASTRVAYKSLTATANAGYLLMNLRA